ncbi:intradiol ring-cleavage dioxygenase [Longispora sp. NPDC051575]|uniref:intradiol ring-cleavage dioxygenase n=1 Tax=Longispora sp. NPDC051575 TaxID=3154943 RepID=UPI00343F4BBC
MTHDHDRGLSGDLPKLVDRRLVDRRLALGLMGGVGMAALVGCSTAPETPTAAPTTAGATPSAATSTAATCATKIPQETAGPYPGDGSNGPNALTQAGIVRTDIRSSFAGASGTARGVPLTIRLNLQQNCAPLAKAAVYLWHCDREGRYSMYSNGVTNENYLRGVQETDAQGGVTFTSIFPAAYSGRWPHIHFEVYPSLSTAATAKGRLVTSQLALPSAACQAVYATDGYSSSVRNMAQTSLGSDMVFRDGYQSQLATVTGGVTEGFTATLTLGV